MKLFSVQNPQEKIIKTIYFLAFSSFAAWQSYFYLYLKDTIGLKGLEIGTIAGFQQLNTLLMLPFWGIMADRYGRRNIFLILTLITSVLLYLFLGKGIFIYYVFCIIILTLFSNSIGSLLDSISLDYIEQSGRGSYGEFRLWGSFGWAVSTILTGYIVKMTQLKWIFVIGSILMFLAWLITVTIYKALIVKRNLQSLKLNHLSNIIFKNKILLSFLILILLYGIASAPIQLFINLYYNEIGAGFNQIGIAFAVQALSEIPFFFYGQKIVEKIGARRVIFLTMAVTMVRMLLYGIISNPWLAILVGAAHGICLALYLVAMVKYIHQFFPVEWRATGQSFIYAFYFGAGMSLGNLWIGFLRDAVGMKKTMLIESGIIFTLIIISIFFFRYLPKLVQYMKVNVFQK